MKIGDVSLPCNLILAPMAGVSDLPFRLLCRECGAGLVCTQMISAKAILHKNKNTEILMLTDQAERPVSLQLFGSDPEIVSEAALIIEDKPFDLIDINMGCPVPKVVKNGEGSALMRNPKLAAEIVRQTARKIHKGVTVKIRKGFNENEVNAVEFAKRLQDAGACAITVHGRTREQYYSGKADWDIIRRVKEAVDVPVIGNGDVTGFESARAIVNQTGCDGVMIGRAARGNPWIFRRILDEDDPMPGGISLSTEATAKCSDNFSVPESHGLYGHVFMESRSRDFSTPERLVRPRDLKRMIMLHAEMEVNDYGEETGIRRMRKHIAWYTVGYPNSSKLRGLSNNISTYDDLYDLLTLLDL